MHVDNTTAVGIVNNTIKRQRSGTFKMRYFWLLCQEAQKILQISHHAGQENLGDYPTKAHFGKIHQHVRPYYLHEPNSSKVLYQVRMPIIWRDCAEILGDKYHGKIPLPRIPTY